MNSDDDVNIHNKNDIYLSSLTLTGSSTATATETVPNLSLICVAPSLLILKMEILQFLLRVLANWVNNNRWDF